MDKINIIVLEDSEYRIRSFRERFAEYSDYKKTPCFVDYVDNAEECIRLLSEKKYDLIFLDHDLGGEAYVDCDNKNTGSEVARWLCENMNEYQKGAIVICHSLNVFGRKNILNLVSGGYDIPFVWIKETFEKSFLRG